MGLRVCLAVLAIVMTIVSAGLFVSEYRVFVFTRELTSLQARAASQDKLPRPLSGWAQLEMLEYCIEALGDQVFILFSQDDQRQGHMACKELAEELLEDNPANASALTLRAFAQQALGAAPETIQADLQASRLAAPKLTWLADRRLGFAIDSVSEPARSAMIAAEADILLASRIGVSRLTQIYTHNPELRPVILPRVEAQPAQVQRQFLNQTRQLLRAQSEPSE